MNDQTGFNTPDDEGAEDALSDVEKIIEDAANEIDRDGDGVLEESELSAAETDEAVALDSLAAAESKASEHLADLQRLQAEYVNYRKRVDRDRALASEVATARAVESLIPVLDDLAAARDHGDLAEGPFAAIADKLETALGRLGWSSYGAKGEAFDPALHDALLTQTSADVKKAQIAEVAQPGHKFGDKVLRPARVVVVQPED
jgi:molecular chaperone GrpE